MLRFLVITFSVVFLLAVAGVGAVGYVFWHFGRGLPDYRQLADYEPPVTTRLYAGDGRLITEYATERRVFTPLKAMPRAVIQAFLSAEDKSFYSHPGLDVMGLARAVITNVKNMGSNRRPVGASTITQQVAKNFLLTNEVSFDRKAKEAILALRIEQTFSKDHILELYLNEIYLGFGSYGVAAAAMNYFNKSLDQLTVAEAAYLAALPKAPNNYHPTRRHDAAVERRNWVISRMLEDGAITAEQAAEARAEPLVVRSRDETEYVRGGGYFAEEVRRELVETFGEKTLYEGGLAVRTTLEPRLQAQANKALVAGLIDYDRRHGWRGPLATLPPGAEWKSRLAEMARPDGMPEEWTVAVALQVTGDAVTIGLPSGAAGKIPFAEMRWARKWLEGQRFGAPPKKPSDVLTPGDIIAVEPVAKSEDGKTTYPADTYGLRQIPNVNGALVALDPHTGRVLAMAGGFSQEMSEFNRATQALRQPGSAFKPFVYLAALENGYTPSTLVLDAPFVYDQGPGLPKWKPKNYSGEYYGPTTLRVGIEASRNLMTVRLAQAVGMSKVADKAKTFGIDSNFPRLLAASLGSGETTVLRLTTAYGMLANGGKRITPTLIDRIQDRKGATIYKHDARPCDGCANVFWTGQPMPQLPDTREQIADPRSVYQIVHIMEGVIENGTGRRLRDLGVPLAGKTGTTNESFDAWFIGFTPDLVVGVFVGFDVPRTLGAKETGSSVALPVFHDFMREALKGTPVRPFAVPRGIQLVRVNHDTGRIAMPGDTKVILEAFKTGNVPVAAADPVLDGSAPFDLSAPDDTYGDGSAPATVVIDGAGSVGEPSPPASPAPAAPVGAAPATPYTPPYTLAPRAPSQREAPRAGGLY
ncbi:penicillin-binding protein 1A [Novispirillum sp. DQ9]|uniref:penicillin-binding protein 1A n=1 Tax=Novispirillum sp. DQ9 TaxID=3398612 RepID=UPI003C7BBD3B